MDLTETIVPRSDQLNSDDLISGPRTVTITEVRRGASAEQPIDIVCAELDRPFKPSLTVRRVLVAAWGKESDAYIGRRMTIYRDPEVKWGGQDVGGIRVSHLSHIAKPMKLALTVTKGKKAPTIIQPLPDAPPPAQRPEAPGVDELVDRAQNAATVDDLNAVARIAARALDADDLELVKGIVVARRAELQEAATLPGTEAEG